MEVEELVFGVKGRSEVFCVRLVKRADMNMTGMNVDFGDGEKLRVTKVYEGLVQEYNDLSRESLTIRKGDYILEVNGVKGDSKAMKKKIGSMKNGSTNELWFIIKKTPPDLID